MSEYLATRTVDFDKAIRKISKKTEIKRRLDKKMVEILENPHHYKPLRNILKNRRRAHIGSFVLVFEVNEAEKIVTFHKFQHHDEVYEK